MDKWISDSCVFSLVLLLFVLSNSDILVFVLFYYIFITTYKLVSVLMRDRKGVNLGGKGGGEELRE